MRTSRDTAALSYPLRLPNEVQADALRLLERSREVINLVVTALWDRLDAFATRTNTYAYKQVEEMIFPPVVHGHRSGGVRQSKLVAFYVLKPSASSSLP